MDSRRFHHESVLSVTQHWKGHNTLFLPEYLAQLLPRLPKWGQKWWCILLISQIFTEMSRPVTLTVVNEFYLVPDFPVKHCLHLSNFSDASYTVVKPAVTLHSTLCGIRDWRSAEGNSWWWHKGNVVFPKVVGDILSDYIVKLPYILESRDRSVVTSKQLFKHARVFKGWSLLNLYSADAVYMSTREHNNTAASEFMTRGSWGSDFLKFLSHQRVCVWKACACQGFLFVFLWQREPNNITLLYGSIVCFWYKASELPLPLSLMFYGSM